MKKSIIAAGAASVALAAMPVLGVFAATSGSFTDTLTVTIDGGCTLENSTQSGNGDYTKSDRSFSATIGAGTVGYLNATDASTASTDKGTVSIVCNTDQSTATFEVTVDIDGLTSGNNTISGLATTSGNTSGWAIKSNATGATSNPFANYTAAADGTFLEGNAAAALTFNPTYQVYIAPNQATGTYTGHAVYTIDMD